MSKNAQNLLTFSFFFILLFLTRISVNSQSTRYHEVQDRYDGCTTIMVGHKASADGSVMTSHTMDEHRARSWLDIQSSGKHVSNSKFNVYKVNNCDTTPMPTYAQIPIGAIPQVERTYGYINTSLPCMNDHQLAIGESTFGGRSSLRSENGLIDLWRLVQLLIERCTHAKEAVLLAGELTSTYGWIDVGECLTIADTEEVWHFEIVGPGKGNRGSVWAAQRIPDDHVGVNANASRIRQIDLSLSDSFLASDNIFTVAQDSGWWNPEDGSFEFCYAYDPDGRASFASRRREWRVLQLLAPSLNLNPNSENYPFSVKPDSLVTTQKLVEIFQDYYEGTEFNPIKNITWTNNEGKTEISPLANPFMPYDMNPLFRINGGWGWRGERTIARWYTMYATITQSRSWLPDEIGGLVWLALDNVATSVYVPLYCCISDLPSSYKTPGRTKGFSRDSAWWAFNRLSILTSQRWGDMRKDVEQVWGPLQNGYFDHQFEIESKALDLFNENPAKAREFLTNYSASACDTVVNEAWRLGDFLWTKYDEKF